jgi:hypothetical protein
MKQPALIVTCLTLAFLVASSLRPTAASPRATQGDLEARVSALEKALEARTKADLEKQALLEQTVKYVEKQAAAAQELLTALDRAEELGFAAGINWESRKTLLDGFRALGGTLTKDVPKLPPANPVPTPLRPGQRVPER